MKFKIPLFPESFELSLPSGLKVHPEQLETLDQIESQLNENLMQEVIEKMHKFYVEGQAHIREMLPTMIQLGAMTQEQYDLLQKDCPSTETIDDFVEYLEAPFHIRIPEPENCEDGSFGLTAECKWDQEHGVGVWFEKWKPVRVGFAEAGYPW
ncbi:MAG: hypothetical protein HUJ25_00110 [Crocinitomicaceae bacterium]|nr:hypothetical protein [Crocinitomicaceae bacterium]